MNTPLDDGGPVASIMTLGDKGEVIPVGGLSIRDWLAGMALQGLLANPGGPIQANGMTGWGFTNCTPDQVAQQAIGMTEVTLAMLAARKEKP